MLTSIKSLLRGLEQNNKKLLEAVKNLEKIKTYERLLPAILEIFIGFSKAKRASLLIPASDGILEIKAASNISKNAWKTTRLKSGEGLAGLALSESKIIYSDNLEKDYRYRRFSQKAVERERITVVPLFDGAKKLGAVCLHGAERPDENSLALLAGFMSKSLKTLQLELAVVTEPMTGLYNQNYLKERLAYEINLAEKYKLGLVLMLFDIDYFKKFNDTYGHLAGDFVIKEVAWLFKSIFRFSDVKSRYGGEEFAAILQDADEKTAYAVAERLRKKIEETVFEYEDKKLKVTISVGLAQLIKKSSSMSMIKNADSALYLSKQNGRNRTTVFKGGQPN